jgi:phospholipase C
MPRPRLLTVTAALAALVLATPAVSRAAKPARLTPVRHVFVYVMENTSFNDVFGSKDAPYLNSLVQRYALATDYTATGHASLDNYIAMTSGQAPNPATSGDCFFYGTPFCIQDVPNIADQLEAKKLTWKGYMDSMPRPCAHTQENTVEQSQTGYSPRHNPFVYYRSIMGNDARCKAHVVPLTDLWKDQEAGRVPSYAFVTPDTCHDGHDSGPPCKDGGGVREADLFASRTLPRIMADPSFRQGGLIVVTFDEGGVANDDEPLSADAGGGVDFGGRIFTLLVSPNVTKGATLTEPYNHYSMLKTVEDVFCLGYLGGAADPNVRSMVAALHQKRCATGKA